MFEEGATGRVGQTCGQTDGQIKIICRPTEL
jgi:hypothetical protein